MNVLIDIGHPGHVHFFKNVISLLIDSGHRVSVTARKIDIAQQLLSHENIQYEIVSNKRTGLLGLGIELIEHTHRLLPIIKRDKIDICASIGGTYTVFASRNRHCRSIVFTDTDTATLANRITFPMADIIATPEVYPNNLGAKQRRYKGFHELSYLHPARFTPNDDALAKYGLSKNDYYSIVRLCSWEAAHDFSVRSANNSQIRGLIHRLKERGKVVIVPEGKVPDEFTELGIQISPQDFHNVIAYASCCVTEGATTASEASILGTPSLYINPLRPCYIYTMADYGILRKALPDHDLLRELELLPEKEKAKDISRQIIRDHIDVAEHVARLIEETSKI